MTTVFSDLRQTFRAMRKNAGSTALAVLMLALGIGATTTIFSVFYSVLLQPLPFAEPQRLVEVWESRVRNNLGQTSFSEANFWDVRSRNHSFEDMGAFRGMGANMTGLGKPEQLSVGQVSAGFFHILGVKPVLGRDLLSDEDQPGHENHVLLIANKYWKARFGADRNIVGSVVRLDGHPFTVVGVLPTGEPWLNAANVFVPLVYNAKADRGSWEFAVIGRLRNGVPVQAAQADLTVVTKSLAEQYPKDDEGMGASVSSAQVWVAPDDLRRALWVLMGAVGFLLMIACVNLANVLLARATGRAREIAVRTALGATQLRLVRMVLTESLVLGAAGAACGIALAELGITLIKSAELEGIPRMDQIGLNYRVLGFTLVISVLTGIFSGLVPAFQTPYRNIVTALREGERGQAGSRAQKRLRSVLVAAEVALSLMLLAGAGLLVRSFDRILRVERGFQSDHRLVATVSLPSSYKKERANDTLTRLLERLNTVSGVVSASAVNSRPIVGWNPGMGIVAAERPQGPAGNRLPWAGWRIVTGEYFHTMGIPMRSGRTFTERDLIAAPWRVIISQRLADMLFPGENPVGRQALLWKGQNNLPAEIIGVAANQRERGLDSDPTLTVYLPYYGASGGAINMVVHTSGEPTTIVPTFRAILADIDADLPLSRIETLDELVSGSLATRRFQMFLLMIFAGVALLLAMTGIYGVLAYTVARRTSEIGLRVALGASHRNVVTLIIGQGMRPILIGMVAGLLGALGLSRFLTTLLFGIKPADPITYVIVACLVIVTALIACYVPALRALRVDPVAALREE